MKIGEFDKRRAADDLGQVEEKVNKNTKRQTKSSFLLNAAILLGGILIGLVLVNAIFSQVTTARWDLTADGQYTLSPATQRLLSTLDSKLTIKIFLSRDLPAPDNTLEQRARDLLSEFEAASHGNLAFEIIRPESKADEAVAKGFGLRKVAVSQRDDSQRSLRLVFKGMTVIYRDTAETIPELRAEDNLEYLIAKSIVNLTAPEKKTVGVLTGFGGLAESPILIESMQTVFHEVFGKRIQVSPVRVSDTCELDPMPDALVILNIQTSLSECAQYAIEQSSFKKTSLAVLQSPTHGDYRQPDQPRLNVDAHLNALLANTGIQLNADLLLDRTHNLVGQQYTADDVVQVSLPALPIITQLDKSHPMTQNLTALVLPFSGTLAIDKNRIEQQGSLDILAYSADTAVVRPSGGDIEVSALTSPRDDEKPGPHPLIAVLQTKQTSQFTDKRPDAATQVSFIDHANNVRYFIVPNGEFLFTNKIIGYTDAFAKLGIHLFVNAVEWLVQDEALIEIRNRTLPQMVQKPDTAVQKKLILINVVGIPALVILIMIAVQLRRRHRMRNIKNSENKS